MEKKTLFSFFVLKKTDLIKEDKDIRSLDELYDELYAIIYGLEIETDKSKVLSYLFDEKVIIDYIFNSVDNGYYMSENKDILQLLWDGYINEYKKARSTYIFLIFRRLMQAVLNDELSKVVIENIESTINYRDIYSLVIYKYFSKLGSKDFKYQDLRLKRKAFNGDAIDLLFLFNNAYRSPTIGEKLKPIIVSWMKKILDCYLKVIELDKSTDFKLENFLDNLKGNETYTKLHAHLVEKKEKINEEIKNLRIPGLSYYYTFGKLISSRNDAIISGLVVESSKYLYHNMDEYKLLLLDYSNLVECYSVKELNPKELDKFNKFVNNKVISNDNLKNYKEYKKRTLLMKAKLFIYLQGCLPGTKTSLRDSKLDDKYKKALPIQREIQEKLKTEFWNEFNPSRKIESLEDLKKKRNIVNEDYMENLNTKEDKYLSYTDIIMEDILYKNSKGNELSKNEKTCFLAYLFQREIKIPIANFSNIVKELRPKFIDTEEGRKSLQKKLLREYEGALKSLIEIYEKNNIKEE